MRRKILDFHPWETAGWPSSGSTKCIKCSLPVCEETKHLWCSSCNRKLRVEEKITIMKEYYEKTIKRMADKLEKAKEAIN